MKKWMVYYINPEGNRDGNEYILAETREEAEELYRRYFNVKGEVKVCGVFPGLGD